MQTRRIDTVTIRKKVPMLHITTNNKLDICIDNDGNHYLCSWPLNKEEEEELEFGNYRLIPHFEDFYLTIKSIIERK